MKDHTPQKRAQAIVSFSKEHHFSLLLVWKIRQGLDKAVATERISNYVLYFFKEDLEKHFKDEELLLFSKLPVDDVLRMQGEAEHQSIYRLVNAIEANKNDAAILRQLADLLEQHIRFEERELFNHLQDTVSAVDLAAVSNRSTNDSKVIDGNWQDQFWEIKK